MNKIEDILDMITERLVKIDNLRGSLDSGTKERKLLDVKREKLEKRQKKLIKKIFDENIQEYKDISSEISRINADLREVMKKNEKIAVVVKTIDRFVVAIDKLLKIALTVAGA